ncbi:RHS repeat protein [Luteimonas fraxinea]|uniref:RHS repeat protein n=1 Tax=Luteimonas fraxinea TaxID=2901869 RepID=UPI001E3573E9|nr:RHS repeat protein [Luteimonas fraxinea]MCD9126052.1 RHS repeat protein [Luteimonas fraxinea]
MPQHFYGWQCKKVGEIMRKFLVGAFVCGVLLSAPAFGQGGKEVWEEYGKRIERSRAVSPLGPDLMGDEVSLSDGSLSFRVTDLSIPGNDSLPVAFTRKMSVVDRTGRLRDAPLGDWDIELPSISGVFSPDWVNSRNQQARCSGPPMPPTVRVGTHYFSPNEYWNGIHLNIPGGAAGELLVSAVDPTRPLTGASKWVTGDGLTFVTCLQSIGNGAGEGFLATTPDGTKYWFNWMAQFVEPALKAPGFLTSVGRRNNVLYATRVEDRFGNFVNYTYTNNWNAPVRLVSIQGSDGRNISVSYGDNGKVGSISDGARSWAYLYSSNQSLNRVSLPDGTGWDINFDQLSSTTIFPPVPVPGEPWRSCIFEPEATSIGPVVGFITHPSGATAQFSVDIVRHGRTNVPINCDNFTRPYNDPNDDVSFWTLRYDNFSLLSKTIAGPGLTPATWTYSYSSPASFYYPSGSSSNPVCLVGMNCSIPRCVSDDCAGSSRTTVLEPGGNWTAYRHGNSYRYNEGKLLSVEQGAGEAVLKRVVNHYDYLNPLRFGASNRPRGNGFSSEFVRPQLRSVTSQQGVDFSWSASGFDAFARPTNLIGWSNLPGSPSRETVTQYHDNLNDWVIGQIAKEVVDGTVTAETTYDANDRPSIIRQFGRITSTLTYDMASPVASGQRGTVKTVANGKGDVTSLSGWKRGLVQSIRHPATADSPSGATQAAVVNDQGFITRVTDENGFQTNYQYDLLGRLTQVNYPIGDSVSWSPTTISFARSAGGAYGMPAGHWRQTITTGQGVKETYFDALWRPVLTRDFDASNANETQRFVRQGFDYNGRVIFSSSPSVSASPATGVWKEYDALGRPTSISQDSELGLLTTRNEYINGFGTRVTDPSGRQTTSRYMAWDAPVTDFPTGISHPEGAYTRIARDVFGKPLSITRQNNAGTVSLSRRFVYDAFQQLCKIIEPETGATIMAYDAVGNLAWTRAGTALTSTASCNTNDVPLAQRTVRSYDARNRVQALTFPDNLGDTTFSYTPDGLLSYATVDNGGTGIVGSAYTYNRRRMLVGEAIGVGSHQWGMGYGYDQNGSLQIHTFDGEQVVDYAPNALGQATKAGPYASNVSWFPNGAIKRFTYGNGIVRTLSQNARGLPERARDVHGSTVAFDESMDYDHSGNVAAISDGLAGGRGNRTMTYDGLNRLIGVTSPMFGGATYVYDALDNVRSLRLTAGPKARDHTYIYDVANRLTSVTNTAGGAAVLNLAYDEQGNLANRNGQPYQFDHGNRLRSVPSVESYLYDVHGRRVQAIRQGKSIFSVYGQDGKLRYQHDERAGKTQKYVYLGGALIAQIEGAIALGAPTLSVPGFSDDGTFTVAWTTSVGASRYELQERVSEGAWNAVFDGAGTSRSFVGKPAGTWGYRVRACAASNCGDWSPVSEVTVQAVPSVAPSLVVPPSGPGGAYAVTWGVVSAATTYQLQERKDSGSWATIYDGGGTGQNLTGRTAGSWSYQVRACNAAGCGPWSPVQTVAVVNPPASGPTLTVPATSYTGTYTVSWTNSASANRYELQERFDSGDWTLIHELPETSRAVSGRVAGVWEYRVRACNGAGCSAYGAVATTTVTLAPVGVPSVTVPAISFTGAFTVSWTSVEAANRYELQERLGAAEWVSVQDAASLNRAVSGKGAGDWQYRVRACNAAGCAAHSSIVSVQVTLPPSSAPTLTVPAGSSTGSYQVSWSGVAASTQYRLQERVGANAWATVYEGPGLSLSRSGLANGTWQYQVAACNAAGCGAYSEAKSVAVQLLTPPVPTGLTVLAQGVYCRASWNASPGATSYKLQPWMYEGPDTSFLHDAPCGTREHRVAACNVHGCSAWSAPRIATPGAAQTSNEQDVEGLK